MSASSPEAGRLAGRLCLVTGASRGLGRAVAEAFAAAGAKLVLLARTVGALEEVDDTIRSKGGEAAVLVPHDLADQEGLDRLGASLYERFGHLDVLVGAAGMLGQLSPIGHIPPTTWAQVFAVNVTANYRLLRSLDPLLRRSTAGRALFVTDRTGRDVAYWCPYSASKAALETLVKTYAAEMAKTPVRVALVAPPPMATRLRAQAFPGEDKAGLPQPALFAERLVALAAEGPPEQGAVIAL